MAISQNWPKKTTALNPKPLLSLCVCLSLYLCDWLTVCCVFGWLVSSCYTVVTMYFCEGFLPCMMPSMDGWRDGWMDEKSFTTSFNIWMDLTIHITKLQLQTTFPKPLCIPHFACIHRDPGRWKSLMFALLVTLATYRWPW